MAENNEVMMWLEEIKTAKKREKDYFDDGDSIIKTYDAGEKSAFNILYSNTEILVPALYSNVPRPVVKRRYDDDDPFAKAACDAGTRMLEYLTDTDYDEYESFDSAMKAAVLDAVLPGRGVTSVKYDAEINEYEEDGEKYEEKDFETICPQSRVWNRVYFGYAKHWKNVPWVAYEEHLDKSEIAKIAGKKKANKLKYTTDEQSDTDFENKEENEDKGKRETVCVYQIWDKTDRKIKYVTAQMKEGFLKVEDDPLELNGFFNCPEPIRLFRKPHNLIPTALYKLYETQAKELNRIQQRLNKVIEAIKVRGVYDGALGNELEEIFSEDDNALVPTANAATLASSGGLNNSIWLVPVMELIQTAETLMRARESCKQVIYEITGIGDIVRGQSMASETLGAQKIKEAWGTMRIKDFQKEVQRYALDLMKMKLEIAASKFSEKTWKSITMLPYPTSEEKQKAIEIMKEISAQMQQKPEIQKDPKVQQIMRLAKSPSWKEITDLLKNDRLRSYRIDMETNSTIDIEATEDKQHVAEFMNAFSQFLNGVAPMVKEGMMSFEVAKTMLLGVVRRYRFGREVEDQIKSMQAPQQSGQSDQAKKMQQQLMQEKKKLEEDKKRFEGSLKSEGERLDKENYQLELDKMRFKYEQELAKEKLKMSQEMAESSVSQRENEAIINLKKVMDDKERQLQSLFDKQFVRIQKEINKRASV